MENIDPIINNILVNIDNLVDIVELGYKQLKENEDKLEVEIKHLNKLTKMAHELTIKQGKTRIVKSIAELEKIVSNIKARQAKLPAETELNIFIMTAEITSSESC